MKVKFAYKVGTSQFSAEVDVDEEEWDDMSQKEQLEYLKDELNDRISIVPGTIEEG